ncbi:MAG: vWA domain-containing protein [Dehalococcoidia bacterium]
MNNNAKKIAALGLLMFLTAIAFNTVSFAQSIEPASVTETIATGNSVKITKTVHTPTIPPNADICFLADTTGSMGPHLANVQAGIGTIMAGVLAESPNAQFCAAQYKDVVDPFSFNLDQALTTNTSAVQAAVNSWSASGGGDFPEDQLHALTQMSGAGPGWRASPAVHILVWFGDAPGHEPASGGETLATTIAALQGTDIVVLAFDNAALDATGQATAITSATGGLLTTDVDNVTDAIIAALDAVEIPVTVAMVSDCTSPISTTFAPASQVVNAGDDAVFTETIAVNATAAQQGKTYECDDKATINGTDMTDAAGNVITEHKTITVPDTTAPVARCVETTNPSGKNVPQAPGTGQNEDGFYQVVATDNVDAAPQIFVKDSGSSFVAGPFASGDKLKITQAPGVTPNSKPMAGAVVAHIQLKGDATVYAVDASGNTSAVVSCKVPPPPK